jgi:hypothetical protein
MIEGAGRAAAKLRVERKTIANAARVVAMKSRFDNFSRAFSMKAESK